MSWYKKKFFNIQKAAVTAAFGLAILKLTTPAFIYAQAQDPPFVSADSANYLCDLNPIIANVIRVSVSLAGIVLFAMLIYGGFLYLTSGGDPKGTEQAKSTLTYAIAGIALLVLAWLALLFIQEFTGVQITSFGLPCPDAP